MDRAAVLDAELNPNGLFCLLLPGGGLSPAVGGARTAGISANGDAALVDRRRRADDFALQGFLVRGRDPVGHDPF